MRSASEYWPVGTTTKNRLYQDPLSKEGIDTVALPASFNAELDKAIFSVMEGNNTEADSAVARQAVSFLRDEGAELIVLGCTEIPLLLQGQEASHLINPTALLADAAVGKAIGLF